MTTRSGAEVALVRRGLWLEYVTLGWNVAGSVIVLFAAAAAGSVALVGFGLDSLIEVFASVVVIWELTGTGREREKTALRLIGVAFLVLAAFLLVQSVRALLAGARPENSPLGIAWLALTFVVMLLLAREKGRTGRQLGNAVLRTEARVTLIDACLAGAVLAGLALNAALGWWWTDALAGLVIVFYGAKEGFGALRG